MGRGGDVCPLVTFGESGGLLMSVRPRVGGGRGIRGVHHGASSGGLRAHVTQVGAASGRGLAKGGSVKGRCLLMLLDSCILYGDGG